MLSLTRFKWDEFDSLRYKVSKIGSLGCEESEIEFQDIKYESDSSSRVQNRVSPLLNALKLVKNST